ncbi:MAG: type II secretion system protein GspN [Desulfobacterales bacterium]|nr:type II secretion system protein GspN [Desulfobacterales bacterium]
MKKRYLYSLWFLGCTLFFIGFLFPSDFFEAYVEGNAGKAFPQASVDLEDLGLTLPPGLSVGKVSVVSAAMPPVVVEDLQLLPRWLPLFTGSPGGVLKATLWKGSLWISVRGGLSPPFLRQSGVKVSALDVSGVSPFLENALPFPIGLSGRMDGELSLKEETGLKGEGNFTLSGFILGLKNSPFGLDDIVFSSVKAEVKVNGYQVIVKGIKAKGPQISADFRGKVMLSPQLFDSRISLVGTLSPDPAFVEKLSGQVPLAMLVNPAKLKQKRISLRIQGTLANPRVSLN